MHIVENAMLVGRSCGDSDVYIFINHQTGSLLTVHTSDGLAMELGEEGTLTYKKTGINQLISFEPVQEEVFA